MEYKIVLVKEHLSLEEHINKLTKDGWIVKNSITDEAIIMERNTRDAFIDILKYMSNTILNGSYAGGSSTEKPKRKSK